MYILINGSLEGTYTIGNYQLFEAVLWTPQAYTKIHNYFSFAKIQITIWVCLRRNSAAILKNDRVLDEKLYSKSYNWNINDYRDKQLDQVTIVKHTIIFNILCVYITDQLTVLYRKKKKLQLKYGKF